MGGMDISPDGSRANPENSDDWPNGLDHLAPMPPTQAASAGSALSQIALSPWSRFGDEQRHARMADAGYQSDRASLICHPARPTAEQVAARLRGDQQALEQES